MNIAVSINDNTLYVVAGDINENKAAFHKSPVKFIQQDKEPGGGYFWEQVSDDNLVDTLNASEKVIITIPARISFCKKVFINSELIKNQKNYLEWYAGKQLPGDISRYIYGFIPLVENDPDEKMIEALFYATISERFWPIYYALARDDILDKVNLIPEFLGLYYLLVRAMDPAQVSQSGLVNFHGDGAAAVFSSDGAFSSARYFPKTSEGTEYLKNELEAFFLSLIDSESPAEILITGRESLKTLRFNMEINLKLNPMSAGFVAGIGALSYIEAGGECELPAGI